MQRSSFVSAGALAALAAVGGRPARAQSSPDRLRVGGVPTDDMTPLFWGVKSGMYQREGLDVEIVPTSSGTAATTAVVSGAYEAGKSSLLSIMAAFLRELPIAIVAPGAVWNPKVPFALMLVAADTPYKTGADLNGKTLGVPALNDLNTLVMSAWVDKNGGDSKTLKFVEIPNSVGSAALIDHRIDACVMQDPQLAEATETRKVRVLGPAYSAVSTNFMFGGYFANTDWASKHPETVKKFAQITGAAAAYAKTHPAQTATMMAEATKIPLAVFSSMARVQSATKLDPALVQPLIDVAAKYKQIPHAFPAAELFYAGK
jgi:NitT/TauT family transport system substrate-binding protein